MCGLTAFLNRDLKLPEDSDEKKILEEFVNREFESRLEILNHAFRYEARADIESAYQHALEASKAKDIVKGLSLREPPLYLMDYHFLEKAYTFLIKDSKEGFCIVTGPELEDSVFVLTRRFEPDMKIRTSSGAEPEFGSMLELLIRIENEQGERMASYFHSHRGEGAGSTTPSGIDLETQEKLERGGYPVIGVIFSRDGYVRFFSDERAFDIEISGKGGEQIEQNLFKLSCDEVPERDYPKVNPGG